MGRLLLSVLILTIFSCINCFAADWLKTNGPYGGQINSLVMDPGSPQTIYAGSNGGGIFKSVNGGENWTPCNVNITALTYKINRHIRSLAIDPKSPLTIYAGTESAGILKSTNGGESWSAPSYSSKIYEKNVSSIVIDPATPTIIFAGTSNGVFKSSNGAVSWISVNSGLTNTDVRFLAIDASVNPRTIYAATGGGVFKSVDEGTNWTAAGLGAESISTLVIDPVTPQTIYAGTGSGIYKSEDGGTNWTPANNGLSNTTINSLTASYTAQQTTIFAGTGGGVFKSIDNGASWSLNNNGLSSHDIRCIIIGTDALQTMYAGTGGAGIFKSVNDGALWENASSGLSATHVNALAITSSVPQAIYAGTNDGIFLSSDGGEIWSTVNAGLTSRSVKALAIDPGSPRTIYAGTLGGVFKTINGGEIWKPVNNGLINTYVRSLAIDTTNPAIIYAGTDGGVFRTVDGGTSWIAINNGLTNLFINVVAIDPSDPLTIHAGTDLKAFKSTDGGESWSENGFNNAAVYSFAFAPTNPQTIYAGTLMYYGSTLADISKSAKGVGIWSGINNSAIKFVRALAIAPSAPLTIYAGSHSWVLTEKSGSTTTTYYKFGGMFKSIDGGINWSSINSGLTNTNIKSLAFDPSNPIFVYAGTAGGGVFKSTYNGVCGESNTRSFDTAPDSGLCSAGIPSPVTGTPNGWAWTCTGTSTVASSCSSTVNNYILAINITGIGTVTSSAGAAGIPEDINCTTNNSGTCQAAYPLGKTVTLTGTPPWYSAISWTGCTAVDKQCNLTMSKVNNVTATFTEKQSVKRGEVLYPTIQSAYNSAGPDASILAQDSSAVTFLENLVFDQPAKVNLEGGKDAVWSDSNYFTLIDGSLTIKNGSVAINRVAIR